MIRAIATILNLSELIFSGSQGLRYLGAGKAPQSYPIVDGEEFHVLCGTTADFSQTYLGF